MIETIEVNTMEVQGIWDEEDEMLKSAVAVWGILPKGMIELKKRVLEDNVANITRSGRRYCILYLLQLGSPFPNDAQTLRPKASLELN